MHIDYDIVSLLSDSNGSTNLLCATSIVLSYYVLSAKHESVWRAQRQCVSEGTNTGYIMLDCDCADTIMTPQSSLRQGGDQLRTH
jgi:hypothetical protein